MEEKNKHIIIIAGEASGDLHAAHLVKEIKSLAPGVTFSGLGGQKMKAAGVTLYMDLTELAVVGFAEVIKHLGSIRKAFRLILKKVKETNADAVILVDYPGFNVRLARALKKTGVKVIYYISPQVWAWKENRVKLIKKFTDKMIVLFEFEKELYTKHGIDVFCSGHPLLDVIKVNKSREQLLSGLGLAQEKFTAGILPGSREKEIECLLPVMVNAAKILYTKYPTVQFLLMKAPGVDTNTIERHLTQADIPIKITDSTYDGINASDICMVASGTATLETAILQRPMVVVYKTSLLTWILAKLFIKIPYIGLVNVVAGKKIVPECIQFDATPQKICAELELIFQNEPRISNIKSDLAAVKASLGDTGASKRAAAEIFKII